MLTTNEMQKIFVWGGWKRNVGDLALLLAQCSMLNVSAGNADTFDFVPLNSHIANGERPVLTLKDIESINKIGSAVIVGAGGQLMPRNDGSSPSEWQFEVTLDDLSKLEQPLILYGLGLNEFPHSNYGLSDYAKEHFATVARQAVLVSARDTVTQEFIQDLGIECDLIPDPAMFCPSTPYVLPDIEPRERLLGFAWAGDRPEARIQKGDTKEEFIDRICDLLIFMCNRYGFDRVVFIPHVSIYDNNEEDMALFRNRLDDRYYNVAEKVFWLYPESTATIGIIKGLYRQIDFMVGMRWHSNILAFSEAVPSLPLGDHVKTAIFSKDISTPNKENRSYACDNTCDIPVGVLDKMMDVSYIKHLEKKAATLKNKFFAYNKKVVEAITNYGN